ncbi:hypothetical protein BDW22DRAFT_1352295 [Trametopsis cervina]|nr:hypothetical protein BDW22DRAFT_1352295 [Trametopsis cervina]
MLTWFWHTQRIERKDGLSIKVGDTVWTRFRDGKHEGDVKAVAKNEQELKEAGNLVWP